MGYVGLMNYRGLMEYLGCGKTRAYQLLKSSCFPTIKINKNMYVTKDAVDRWLLTYEGKQFLV